MEIGLSLGANLGDRLGQLSQAKAMILALPGIKLAAQSPVYETEPVDVPAEFSHLPFLNGVLIIETLLPARQIMNLFHFIEQKLGRVPNPVANAPRSVDIDIIYADLLQLEDDRIIIPHPRWAIRRFVVQPLGDVRPDLRIPGQTGTVAEVLAQLQDPSKVTLFTRTW
jgi:2-amino-4-hydroxy-6-hydroxymethyldihydropteridine diphosphokinase